LAGEQAAMEAHRRELERQANDLGSAMQVRAREVWEWLLCSGRHLCGAALGQQPLKCWLHSNSWELLPAIWLGLVQTMLGEGGRGVMSWLLLPPAVLQSLKEQEMKATDRERALGRAEDPAQQQQQQLLRQEEAVAAATRQLESERAAAAAQLQELERQRKAVDGARRVLAGVEAALDARESQLQDSWQLLEVCPALRRCIMSDWDTCPCWNQ